MESRRGGGGGQEFDSREAPTASGGDHSPTRRDDANAPSGTTSGMHAPTSTPRTCLSFVAAPPASAAPRGSCPSRGSARARERRSDEKHLPKIDDDSLLFVVFRPSGGFFGLPHSRARPTMRAVRLLAVLACASLLFTAVSCQDADDELPPLLQACRAQVRRPSGSGYFRDRTVRFRAVRAPHVPSTHPPSPPRLPRSSSRSSRTSPRSSTPTAPS